LLWDEHDTLFLIPQRLYACKHWLKLNYYVRVTLSLHSTLHHCSTYSLQMNVLKHGDFALPIMVSRKSLCYYLINNSGRQLVSVFSNKKPLTFCFRYFFSYLVVSKYHIFQSGRKWNQPLFISFSCHFNLDDSSLYQITLYRSIPNTGFRYHKTFQ
jgi:hypothetical protein